MNDLVRQIQAEPGPAFWWLGQIGYALKLSGLTVYIDVFFSEHENRRAACAIAPEEAVGVDIVMGTHDHIDHIDHPAWKKLALASPKAVFVVPAAVKDALVRELDIPAERFVGVDDGETVAVKGLEITGVAAAHEFFDRDPATGKYPYLGYSISDGRVRVFHSGDSCIYDGLADRIISCGKPDVMFLPINGRDARRYLSNCLGNMTFQEAVDLCGRIRPGLAVPGHYDMFAFNSEEPAKFVSYLEAKYPGIESWVGGYGEKVAIEPDR